MAKHGAGKPFRALPKDAKRMIREIEELQASIRSSELSFDNRIMRLKAQATIAPSYSTEAQHRVDEILGQVHSLEESTNLGPYKADYEKELRKFQQSQDVVRRIADEKEMEIQIEMGALFRPFLNVGKSGAKVDRSTGTLSPFVSMPDESKPLLERIDLFEAQLTRLKDDYNHKYKEEISRHVAADRMVQISEGVKVEKGINLFKVVGKALEKQQALSAAQAKRNDVQRKLEELGYTPQQQDMYHAAKTTLKMLPGLRRRLLENHELAYVRPAVAESVHMTANRYDLALKARAHTSNAIIQSLEDLMHSAVSTPGAEKVTKMSLASFSDLRVKTVSSPRSYDDDTPSSPSSASITATDDPSPDLDVIRKDLELSLRTKFLQNDLDSTIYAALNDHCERTGTDAKVFHDGKPSIDFKEFLTTHLPNPEYGPEYRRRFSEALEKVYERMKVGGLIDLMEKEKIRSLASTFQEEFSSLFDSVCEHEGDGTIPLPKGTSKSSRNTGRT
jgi:hypothetical protein